MTEKQIMQSSIPEKCLSRLLFHSSSPSISVPFCVGEGKLWVGDLGLLLLGPACMLSLA